MSGLRVLETIKISTDIGQCQIQLWCGDITALPKEEKVDVLVISAYPGDYSPTPTSLIGQLSRKLQVNVRALSNDKEEDLRKLHSCWWTKPLPDHLSFGKILCFEGSFKKGKTSGSVVGDVFRCLVSVLANREGTVMMPVLASGDQGYSKKRMLELIVNAAVHWMRAGLPLRCLKIVLFVRDVVKLGRDIEALAELFRSLKTSYEAEDKVAEKDEVDVVEFDVYLSYNKEDEIRAKEIACSLKNVKNDLRIFSTVQQLDMEDSWQKLLYRTITSCQRVVAVITPAYLNSSSCIEQYNIALCHSRRIHQSCLMPLYVSDVPFMPTYMQITQYIDCRIQYSEKIEEATTIIINSLSLVTVGSPQGESQGQTRDVLPSGEKYDVFLSYSHRNKDKADIILQQFRDHYPHLNIFIDSAELKAGGTWQQTLYHALDATRIVIALISDDYLNSKVCLEELSLSIAVQMKNGCKLFPLIIEQLKDKVEWLDSLSRGTCIDEKTGEHKNLIEKCQEIVQGMEDTVDSGDEPSLTLALAEEFRSALFKQGYIKWTRAPESQGLLEPRESTDIYVLFAPDDHIYFEFLEKLLLSMLPDTVIKTSRDGNTTSRLKYLDDARLVIPLLSQKFMTSPELIHELNIAWCRQRSSDQLCFLAIVIDVLPKEPTYIHALPVFFNCEDIMWNKSTHDDTLFENIDADVLSDFPNTHGRMLCLVSASVHICKCLQDVHNGFWEGFHNKFFNLASLPTSISCIKEKPNRPASGVDRVMQKEGTDVIGRAENGREGDMESQRDAFGVLPENTNEVRYDNKNETSTDSIIGRRDRFAQIGSSDDGKSASKNNVTFAVEETAHSSMDTTGEKIAMDVANENLQRLSSNRPISPAKHRTSSSTCHLV